MWLIKAMASPDSIQFEPVIQDFHETIIFMLALWCFAGRWNMRMSLGDMGFLLSIGLE
jgi:hypothetical protein